MSEPTHNQPVHDDGFDRQEVNARFVAVFALATIIGLVVIILGIQYYHDVNYGQQIYERVLQPVGQDLQELRAREDQHLHSYEYIDREQGTVRLTIERAMELLIAEYSTGALKYPTTPYEVTKEEEAGASQQQSDD